MHQMIGQYSTHAVHSYTIIIIFVALNGAGRAVQALLCSREFYRSRDKNTALFKTIIKYYTMKWKPIAAAVACTMSHNHTSAHTCPCFSLENLRRITSENVDARRSCTPAHGGWALWRQPIHTLDNHGFGYMVRMGTGTFSSTCLIEGDMMMEVSEEDAATCAALIQQRCTELGLIQP